MDFLRISSKIEWCEAGPAVDSWVARGIAHGFSGKIFAAPQSHHYLKQVHGVALRKASERTAPGDLSHRPEGDAIYSDSVGVKVAVKTADCLPILLYHPQLVMAIHAGWRSAASGIMQKSLDFYQSRGIAPEALQIALGPCIGPQAFEVGPEVVRQFCRPRCGLSREQLAYCLTKGRGDRWHVDLAVYAVLIALVAGVKAAHISVMRSCTREGDGLWHSYRRDGPKAGRNWAWIAL